MKRDRKFLLGFFIVSIFLVGILVLYIFKPLINTFLLGVVFSFLFHPFHKWILKFFPWPRVAAFASCLLFILIITIPLFFAVNALTVEVVGLSNRYTETGIWESVKNFDCPDNAFCNLVKRVTENTFVMNSIHDFVTEFSDRIKLYVGEILIKLPNLFVHAFIIIFMMYYLLLDGEKLIGQVKSYLPIARKHKETLFREMNRVMGGILFGSILVGALQGFLGGLGFLLFGIKAPVLWGIIMFLLSFLPLIGTSIVWAPVSTYLIVEGMITYDMGILYRGFGLLIYCAIVVGSADNLIRPKLISGKTDLHPVLVMFGVLGGIIVFKAAGVIIGPLIFGIFKTLLEMFEKERMHRYDTTKS